MKNKVIKLKSLLTGLLNLQDNNGVLVDARGGYWVYSYSGKAIIGYDFCKGQYAGYFIRFSQIVDKCLLANLENALDNHTPDLSKNWRFNPDIIINDDFDLLVA